MTQPPRSPLPMPEAERLGRAWLRAERDADEPAAEAALASLFAALPLASPRVGFTTRVLRQAGVRRAGRDLFARRGVRWAVAASLVLAAITLLVVPGLVASVLAPFGGALSLAGVLGSAAQLFVLMGRWVSAGMAFWRVASDVGSACVLALSKPPLAFGLFAMAATGALALRALNRLMSPERSTSHVP